MDKEKLSVNNSTSKERIKNYLRELTRLVGVSGAEQEVVKYLKSHLSLIADEVTVDQNGNIIAIKHGNKEGPKIMVSAHSDEIGLCVKNILDDGFIVFDRIGGVPEKLLQGRKVWVTNKKIPGIIGVKPGHIKSISEDAVSGYYIDLGVTSRKEVENMGVEIGDSIVFQSDFMEMYNTDLVSTKSVDNRISCAILLELFSQLNSLEFAGTLYGVITVQEEVGLRGATMVGSRIKPDYAIVLDTIPAGDTPDINTEKTLPVYLGKGPVCPIVDGALGILGFTRTHPTIREMIKEQAKSQEIGIQYLTLVGERYITDAGSIAITNNGTPVGVIAVPRRYSHSPVELVHLNDATEVLRIVKAIVIDNGSRDISFI